MKRYKFSKTYIFSFMYRFGFLLFVPFLQGLLFANQGALKLFTLYSADLLVAFFLFCVAVIRCKNSSLVINNKSLTIYKGRIFKTEERSLLSFKGSVTLTKGLFLRFFKGGRLRVFSGSAYSSAYLKSRDAEEILETLIDENENCRYFSGILRSLLMSISFSNALTGLLAAAPIIRKAASVLGARQTALLLEGATLEGVLRFQSLPPVLSRISAILFLCWVVGFSTEFFREYGLKLCIYPTFLKVSKGLITKTDAVFPQSSVRSLVFRQSLLMFLSGLYSAEVRLNILPYRKIYVLSGADASRCHRFEQALFYHKKGKVVSFYPPKSALWGYTYLPFIFLGGDSLLLILFSHNFFVKILGSILLFVFFVWFLFRFFALFGSSLSFWQGFCQVKYFTGMNFTRSVFRLEDIRAFEITQSVFQQKSGRCNLKIKIGNAKAIKVKIKHLWLSDIEKAAFFLESG